MKELIFVRNDENGNELRCYKMLKARHMMELYLFVFREGKGRKLGIVNRINRTISIKRSRAKHLMQKNSSYGFNYMMLHDAKSFDHVILIDDFTTYKIPREFLLEHGVFLFFKEKGFERQIFVTLEKLEQFNVMAHAF